MACKLCICSLHSLALTTDCFWPCTWTLLQLSILKSSFCSMSNLTNCLIGYNHIWQFFILSVSIIHCYLSSPASQTLSFSQIHTCYLIMTSVYSITWFITQQQLHYRHLSQSKPCFDFLFIASQQLAAVETSVSRHFMLFQK